MEEVLFRGKDKDGNWVEGDLIHGVRDKKGNLYILPIVGNLAGIPNCHPLDGVEVIPETVGRFTGLTDKNKKKIFKGDAIVNINEAPEKYMIVGWSKRFASFILSRKGWMYSHWFGESCDPENCEIIGNVHDNPNLFTP